MAPSMVSLDKVKAFLNSQIQDEEKWAPNMSQLKKFAKDSGAGDLMRRVTGQPAALGVDLDRQLQVWKENPSWVDEAPRIKVSKV